MKIALALLFIPFTASAATEWKSVYTNLDKDCVEISLSTTQAEIDFADSECKAFGGYELHIAGGDLRYGPELSYQGEALEIKTATSFHDMASRNIEWVYTRDVDPAGDGKIEWRGLVYRLSLADASGGSRNVLFAVRLDGKDTCLIGEAVDNVAARDMISKSRKGCISAP